MSTASEDGGVDDGEVLCCTIMMTGKVTSTIFRGIFLNELPSQEIDGRTLGQEQRVGDSDDISM